MAAGRAGERGWRSFTERGLERKLGNRVSATSGADGCGEGGALVHSSNNPEVLWLLDNPETAEVPHDRNTNPLWNLNALHTV